MISEKKPPRTPLQPGVVFCSILHEANLSPSFRWLPWSSFWNIVDSPHCIYFFFIRLDNMLTYDSQCTGIMTVLSEVNVGRQTNLDLVGLFDIYDKSVGDGAQPQPPRHLDTLTIRWRCIDGDANTAEGSTSWRPLSIMVRVTLLKPQLQFPFPEFLEFSTWIKSLEVTCTWVKANRTTEGTK